MPQIAKRSFMAWHNGHTQRRRQEVRQNSVASVPRLWHRRNSRLQQSALSFVKTSCTESNQNRFVLNLFRCGLVMRKLIAPLAIEVLAIVGLMCLAPPAAADTPIVSVENQPDAYRSDQ